jgi:hypothetical protein
MPLRGPDRMLLSLLDDPEHWRSRAEESRTIAEQLSDLNRNERCFASRTTTNDWLSTLSYGREANRNRRRAES